MEIADSSIIKRIQSRTVSKSEFEFDRMYSRPLSMFLSQWDIDRLYAIASSVRYSGNAVKKFKAMDEIMEPRGFTELSAGTNRICYRHREDDSIVVKVAYNDVGRKDNPAEFINQSFLKPFCSKVYEVSSDGTVALDERVKPIKSREEFISVSDDIFSIIWMFTQKYILADFGSHYFMNWGTRVGFGPVILDYSYLYEVDGDKLVCKNPDPTSPSGICGGLIDYDEGFNHLRCTKCGATYRAIEIAKAIKNNDIVRSVKENKKMKVGIRWHGVDIFADQGNDVFQPETETIQKSKPVAKGVPTTEGIPKVILRYVPVKEEEKKQEEVVAPKQEVVEEKVQEKKEEPEKKEVKKESKYKSVTVHFNNAETTSSNYTRKKEEYPRRNNNFSAVNNAQRNNIQKHEYHNNHEQHENNHQQNHIHITAVTFDQLKNLDFKFSSYDAEYHKIFFVADMNGIKINISVDANSIPEDFYETVHPVDNTELEQAKLDLMKAEDANVHKDEKISELNAQLEDISSKNATNIIDLNAAVKKYNELLNEHDNLKKEFDIANDKLAAADSNSKIDSEEKINLYKKTSEQEATIADLNDQVRQLTNLSNDYENQIKDLTEQLNSKEDHDSDNAETIQELQQTINTLTENHNTQAQELADSNQKIQELQSQLDSVLTEQSTDNKEEDESEEEQDYSGDTNYEDTDPDNAFYFCSAEIYSSQDIVDSLGYKYPEGKSKYIITPKSEDGEFMTDQYGRIICMDTLAGNPIEKLHITLDGEDEDDSTTEAVDEDNSN